VCEVGRGTAARQNMDVFLLSRYSLYLAWGAVSVRIRGHVAAGSLGQPGDGCASINKSCYCTTLLEGLHVESFFIPVIVTRQVAESPLALAA
jgi:hypothetical protein